MPNEDVRTQWEKKSDEELEDIKSQLQDLSYNPGYQFLITCLMDDHLMQMQQLAYDTDEKIMRVRQGKIQMINDILQYRLTLIEAIGVEQEMRVALSEPDATRPLNDKGL